MKGIHSLPTLDRRVVFARFLLHGDDFAAVDVDDGAQEDYNTDEVRNSASDDWVDETEGDMYLNVSSDDISVSDGEQNEEDMQALGIERSMFLTDSAVKL